MPYQIMKSNYPDQVIKFYGRLAELMNTILISEIANLKPLIQGRDTFVIRGKQDSGGGDIENSKRDKLGATFALAIVADGICGGFVL